MGPVKRVLMGSAAGIFAVAAAQAADLPVKAKPVEYVKVCSLYGAGFWYVPGTDTCIKIGAYVQAQVGWNEAGNGQPVGWGLSNGDRSGFNTRTDTGDFSFRNRNAMSFDLRTQTEYGTLRSYLDVGTQLNVGTNNNGGSVAVNATTGAFSSLFASRAFIQFAGFTVGRIRSFFDMFNISNYNYQNGQTTGETGANGLFGLAYTWQFGGGLTATLSAEDGGFGTGGRGRLTVNASQASFGFPTLTTDNKGQTTLDPVLNLRLDQAWGFVGVSGALHDASGGYYGTTQNTGHPGDTFGWAVAASFLFNNPFGLQGDTVGAIAAFTRGAAGYATANYGTKLDVNSGTLGIGWITDGVYVNGSGIELTDVWSVTGAYEHVWDPKWRTSLYGGFVGVNYTDAAKTFICASPAAGITFAGGCNPNFSYGMAGTRTQWNPVPDLSIGLDLTWWHLNTAFKGDTATVTATGALPTSTYQVKDQDVFSTMFRVQRNFLY